MLEAEELPAGIAGLDAGLAEVKGDALALRTRGGREQSGGRQSGCAHGESGGGESGGLGGGEGGGEGGGGESGGGEGGGLGVGEGGGDDSAKTATVEPSKAEEMPAKQRLSVMSKAPLVLKAPT